MGLFAKTRKKFDISEAPFKGAEEIVVGDRTFYVQFNGYTKAEVRLLIPDYVHAQNTGNYETFIKNSLRSGK